MLSWIRIRVKKQMNPDPYLENQLDPDPQKMNAEPQPWFLHYLKAKTIKHDSELA